MAGDDQEPIEAAKARDGARDRARRASLAHQLAHDRLESRGVERLDAAARAPRRSRRQLGQVARVALDGVSATAAVRTARCDRYASTSALTPLSSLHTSHGIDSVTAPWATSIRFPVREKETDEMPTRSKWQALPTEAINPASLAIDKLAAGGIVDLMLAEDRKMLAAVQKERDRIALGADMLRQGAAQGRTHRVRRRRHQRPARRPRIGRDAADLRHRSRRWSRRIMAGGKNAIIRAKEGAEDNYEEGARADHAARADEEGRRHRRLGQRHDVVRARRADQRAQGRRRASSSSPAIRATSCRPSSI